MDEEEDLDCIDLRGVQGVTDGDAYQEAGWVTITISDVAKTRFTGSDHLRQRFKALGTDTSYPACDHLTQSSLWPLADGEICDVTCASDFEGQGDLR